MGLHTYGSFVVSLQSKSIVAESVLSILNLKRSEKEAFSIVVYSDRFNYLKKGFKNVFSSHFRNDN